MGYIPFKRISIFLMVVFLTIGCSSEASVSPIPKEDLTEILTEALILEPAGRELPETLQDSMATIYYDKILEQRGYTMEEFMAAMAWLQEDAEELAAVYNEVMEKLTTIESEQR